MCKNRNREREKENESVNLTDEFKGVDLSFANMKRIRMWTKKYQVFNNKMSLVKCRENSLEYKAAAAAAVVVAMAR